MKKIIFTLILLIILKASGAQCIADFSANTSPSSNEVTFQNLSLPDLTGALWDFGDGTFSNDISHNAFVKTYSNPGYYLVKLTMNWNNQCHADTTKLIVVGDVNGLCQSNFNYIVNGGNDVTFTDISFGTPDHWLWEFGDGTYSNAQNPAVHTYPAGGYYKVKLLIYRSLPLPVCMDIYEKVISVGNNNDCRSDFSYIADFSTDSVQFYDASLGNNITNYLWNFNNGTTSDLKDPKIRYVQPGFYNVCLSVWDNGHNCYNTSCQNIAVGTSVSTINASFNCYVNNTSRMVTFQDNSTGNPTNWSWDFGDGSTATSQNVTKVYTNDGFYLVHLRASNGSSSSDYVELISVNNGFNFGVKAKFGYLINNNYHSRANVAVDFKGSSLGDPSRSVWHFGDGHVDSTSLYPLYAYGDTGVYNVCVTMFNDNTNQSDTYCKEIHVIAEGINDSPVSKITINTNPNPFNTSTNITYNLPKTTNVSIIVYDLIGNKKALLVNKTQQQGIYTYIWERKSLSNGIYLLEFKTSSGTIVKKLTLID